MSTLVIAFNRFLGTLVEWVVSSLSFLSPLGTLTVISAVCGVILVFGWGKVSNQKKIKAVKQQMHARLLEAIVFRHDIRVSLKAQAALLGNSLRYFSCALVPLVILGIPCVLLMAQLNKYYAYSPLTEGQQALVDVTVNNPLQLDGLQFTAPQDSLLVDGPVKVPTENRATYRVQALANGLHPFSLHVGNEAPQVIGISSLKAGSSGIEATVSQNAFTALLHPTLHFLPIDGSSIISVAVSYQPSKFRVLNFQLSWELIFFGVSIISGFLIAKLIGIEL